MSHKDADKGDELNERVWRLFEQAGFLTKPNSNNPTTEHRIRLADDVEKPVDLYATDSDTGVAIVGSNKSGPKVKGFYDHVEGLAKLRDSAQAAVGLLVLSEKELRTPEERYLRRKGIHVWRQRDLEYYEEVVSSIGGFAKNEIIHSFGVPAQGEIVKITVPAVRLKQPRRTGRNVEVFGFTLPADQLLKTCLILRKARGSAFAYQRMLTKKRLPRIGEFLDQRDALLPTSIVVHLGNSVVVDEVQRDLNDRSDRRIEFWREHELVALTIPLRYGSMEIVDGQHRLFGFTHSKARTRRDFELVVVGIKGIDEQRRTRTFVAINDKARRVDPSLVAFLRYTDNENVCRKYPDQMAIKVVVELDKAEPFTNRIKLFDIGKQKITLKGFYGYDLKGMVGEYGLLRQHYPNKSQEYVNVLRLYFGVISRLFEQQWRDPGKYVIATNRGISAFLKLLKSILRTENRPLTEPMARKYLVAVRDNWVRRTWETSQLDTSYSASQGWKQFHRDLLKSVRKRYGSFKE